jgi:hypothetical protein
MNHFLLHHTFHLPCLDDFCLKMAVMCSSKMLVIIYYVVSTTHHCNPEEHSLGPFFPFVSYQEETETTKLLDLSYDYWVSGLCSLHTILEESNVLETLSVSVVSHVTELGPCEIASLSHSSVIEISSFCQVLLSKCLLTLSPEDRNRSSFQNIMVFQNIKLWTK